MKYRPPDSPPGQLFAVTGADPNTCLTLSSHPPPSSLFRILWGGRRNAILTASEKSPLLWDSVTKESGEYVYVSLGRRVQRDGHDGNRWNPRWRHRDVSRRVMKQKGGGSRCEGLLARYRAVVERRRRRNLRVDFHFKCADTGTGTGTPTPCYYLLALEPGSSRFACLP